MISKEFPSPCGVLVLKFPSHLPAPSSPPVEFPSPCGVLVLKFMLDGK